MKITKRQLRRIIRESLLLEFKVPNHVEQFAHQLRQIASRAGRADVARSLKAFNSGYIGIHFIIAGEEWYIFDQPGHVGLEDQQMGHITMQRQIDRMKGGHGRKAAWKGLYFSPDYFRREFGDVSTTDEMRKKAYAAIADEFANIIGAN